MQKRTVLISATLIAAVGLPSLAFAATTATALPPADIKTTFGTGTPFTGTNVGGGTYTIVLKADGHATRTAQGKANATTGTWHVNDTGYCSKWGKATEHCYTIQKTATAYDVVDSASKVVAHWKVK